MIAHKSPISGISSFEEKYIATAGYDNQIILWSQDKKEALQCSFHDHLTNHCSFSPCGNYLATASSDYTARLWKIPEMQLVQVFSGHDDDVQMAVISKTNDKLATASQDNKIRVYQLDGTLIHTFEGHSDSVDTVNWSTDGKTLVSSGGDGTIRVWGVDEKKLLETLSFDGVQTDSVVISNGYIYAGNDEGELISVHIDTAKMQRVKAHIAGVKVIQLNDDNTKLVSASYDYTAKIWSLKDGNMSLTNDIKCPAELWLRAVCWINDTKIAFGTFGSSYAVYDLQKNEWNLDKVAPTHGINDLDFENNKVFSVGDSGQLKKNGEIISEVGFLCNFVLKVNGKILVGGLPGKIVEVVSGKVVLEYKSPLNCAVKYENQGELYAIVSSYTGEVLVFNMTNEPKLIKEIKVHANAIKSLAINSGVLFALCANGDCSFFDLPSFELLSKTESAHEQIANGGDSLGNDSFVSVGRDKKLIIWNKEFNPTYYNTPMTHSIKCVATSKDGKQIACGGYNGSVSVYSIESKEWETQRITNSGISSIYYNEYSDNFVASSYNGNVYNLN